MAYATLCPYQTSLAFTVLHLGLRYTVPSQTSLAYACVQSTSSCACDQPAAHCVVPACVQPRCLPYCAGPCSTPLPHCVVPARAQPSGSIVPVRAQPSGSIVPVYAQPRGSLRPSTLNPVAPLSLCPTQLHTVLVPNPATNGAQTQPSRSLCPAQQFIGHSLYPVQPSLAVH